MIGGGGALRVGIGEDRGRRRGSSPRRRRGDCGAQDLSSSSMAPPDAYARRRGAARPPREGRRGQSRLTTFLQMRCDGYLHVIGDVGFQTDLRGRGGHTLPSWN